MQVDEGERMLMSKAEILGKLAVLTGGRYAEDTASHVDRLVSETIKNAHEKALDILKQNQELLHKSAARLLEKETITGDEFMQLMHI